MAFTDDVKSSKKTPLKLFKTTINAGKHKGKSIEIPAIDTTRSSKSILRESLFNTLQFEVIDKNFVEIFGGSGSIGLEALSRGATEAYFIEHNHTAYQVLQKNAQSIDATHTHLFLGDSFEKFALVYQIVKKSGIKSYFYFDPPFSTREGMEDIYNKVLNLIAMIEPSVCEMIIVEHLTSVKMPEEIGNLVLIKFKKFGKSALSYYRYQYSSPLEV